MNPPQAAISRNLGVCDKTSDAGVDRHHPLSNAGPSSHITHAPLWEKMLPVCNGWSKTFILAAPATRSASRPRLFFPLASKALILAS